MMPFAPYAQNSIVFEERILMEESFAACGLPADCTLPAVCTPDTTAENWPQRREQLIGLLEQNVFGRMPRSGFETHAELLERTEAASCGAVRERYRVTVRTQRGQAGLHLALLLPKAAQPVPAVLMISNHDKAPAPAPKPDEAVLARLMAEAPAAWRAETQRMMAGMRGGAPQLLDIDKDETQGYWPAAQIAASGRAAAAFYASEAQPDDRERFPEALAALLTEPGAPRAADGIGTLGVWAFAASRMVDVLCGHTRIDAGRISVAGHSRGGKTALWCAAQDTRVRGVLVNNSGCTGAALSRGKRGENVASINALFPHWFCPRYGQYAWREAEMPFDQHMLLAAVAPRLCYVTSGTQDAWSDPDAEWRGVCEASAAWRLLGRQGLAGDAPRAGEPLCTDGIGYHRRAGGHDLTAWDWAQFLAFLQRNGA